MNFTCVKTTNVSEFLTCCGNSFHSKQPLKANDFLPSPLTLGIVNLLRSLKGVDEILAIII